MKALLKWLLLAAVLCALCPGAAFAAAPALPDDGGYTITSYDVHAVVNEDNSYDITETIAVNFSEARHGIYRYIPVDTELTRTGSDGLVYKTVVPSSVSRVRVEGWPAKVTDEGTRINIRIGDANKTVTGDQTYKISYRLRFGNDGVEAFDEVYFNIIGTDWDTTIGRATFSIDLPKPFDKSKLGFSMGVSGRSGYDPDTLKYTVDGNTIAGELKVPLKSYEGVTMRVELPQGYFKLPDPFIPDYVVIGAIAFLALLSVLLFLCFGIDYKNVQTVEFYAPEGMTPADVGYIFDGCADSRDVVSLIMYWADKGYLSIEELGEGNFRLTKRKEMGNEAKEYERYMFGKLFKKDQTAVETDDLEDKFYKTVASVEMSVEKDYASDDRRLFTKASMRWKPWVGFMTILPVVMTMYLQLSRELQIVAADIFLSILVGLALLLPVFLTIRVMRRWKLQSKKARRIKLAISLILTLGTLFTFLYMTSGTIYNPLRWAALAGTVVIGLCAVFIRKRTKASAEWFAKISSFKDFIELAEREKLVALVEQNPSYFFNVLPYAYVLGVTDKWAGKFESIAMAPPEWYSGMNTAFSPSAFATHMGSSFTSMQYSLTSSPSSSSSGGGGSGFSSGSSSGGGGGGGGGGSW